MSEIKLLPCPFCGRKAELRYNKEGFAYILCANDGCYARTDGCLNENEASRLWNTRKPMQDIVERLEESLVFYEKKKKEAYEDKDWYEFDRYVDIIRGIYEAFAIVKEVGGMNKNHI